MPEIARPATTETTAARVLEAAYSETDAGRLLRPDDVRTHAVSEPFAGEPHDAGESHSVSLTFGGPVDWIRGIHPEELLGSLEAFRGLLGARAGKGAILWR